MIAETLHVKSLRDVAHPWNIINRYKSRLIKRRHAFVVRHRSCNDRGSTEFQWALPIELCPMDLT